MRGTHDTSAWEPVAVRGKMTHVTTAVHAAIAAYLPVRQGEVITDHDVIVRLARRYLHQWSTMITAQLEDTFVDM